MRDSPWKSWKAILLVSWNHKVGHSYEVLFVFLQSLVVEKLRIMSKNIHFRYIRLTFLDIITYHFQSYDSTKTNNTSYECPSEWFQNSGRTAFQLFQGLSRNLFFRKCIFYKKGGMNVPDRATYSCKPQILISHFINSRENQLSYINKWYLIF